MPDYNLFSLSSRSFEQMIQALAIPVFGPNLVIFGDGPDGGREATFQGQVPFPPAQPWDGYGVVQAKFLQRSMGVRNDGKWALDQLKSELKKLEKRRGKRPEYYVFVTNVVLSPPETSGAKDKVSTYLTSMRKKLSLKGWDVWDYDRLRTYLDNNRDVAKAYAAGITPGDVLAQLDEMLSGSPQFDTTITNYLQKELLHDQYAHLEQAGHMPDDRILLSNVFVDLPIADDRQYGAHSPSNRGFVSSVLQQSPVRLDAASASEADIRKGRLVLIGGPGQGKTTVGQYLCQLFRASLLAEKQNISPDSRNIIRELQERCTADALPFPQFRRFPFRIELNAFASSLASAQTTSLFQYILQRIQVRTNRTVSDATLRKWLGVYPWLVVLDGLDEVPASSNRPQVLDMINEFWIDLAECRSDVLVIATTRPQGYSEEFSPAQYTHQYLAPLNSEIALRYGKRLSDSRYTAGSDRSDKVFQRLTRATKESTTAHLMRTPLQVTIMASLVDKLGQPPDQRWSLFKEYYRTIYDRELERQTSTSEILRDHRSDIDIIHYRLGVVLQRECEISGSTEARLDAARFAVLVKDKLHEEGYEGEALTSLTQLIIGAASERLVFIVGVQEGQVGFEIRSLQEFMAGEGIMNGSDEEVLERLRHVAPIVAWRQVFLFTAGHVFTSRRHLRDSIFTLCEQIDMTGDGKAYAAIRLGASLALEIIEDNVARGQPKYERLFIRKALTLLDAAEGSLQVRLAGAYTSSVEADYKQHLAMWLGQGDPALRIGAWICLIELAQRGVEWAAEKVTEFETSSTPLSPYLNVALHQVRPRGMRSLKEKLILTLPPLTTRDSERAWWTDDARENMLHETSEATWYEAAVGILNYSSADTVQARVLVKGQAGGLSIGVNTIGSQRIRSLQAMPHDHNIEWNSILVVSAFVESPSKEQLATVLRTWAREGMWLHSRMLGSCLPWPLRSLSGYLNSADDCFEIANKVDSGRLGDGADWIAAEERWRERGIDLTEMGCVTDDLPFGPDISTHGLQVVSLHPLRWDMMIGDRIILRALSAKSMQCQEVRGEGQQLLSRSFRREWEDVVVIYDSFQKKP